MAKGTPLIRICVKSGFGGQLISGSMLQEPPPKVADLFRHQISHRMLAPITNRHGITEVHVATWRLLLALAAAATLVWAVTSMVIRARHHWRLRVVAVSCFLGADGHMRAAVRAFKQYCDNNAVQRRPSNMHQFIKDAMEALNRTGNLNPPKPEGRRRRLSPNDAMICAEQLMTGYYFTWTNEFGETFTEHKGYDSFSQACAGESSVGSLHGIVGLQKAMQLPEGNQSHLPPCNSQASTRHEATLHASTGQLQG
jgi:hypothetical protein